MKVSPLPSVGLIKETPISEEMGVGARDSKSVSWRADEEGRCGYLCDSPFFVCWVSNLDG